MASGRASWRFGRCSLCGNPSLGGRLSEVGTGNGAGVVSAPRLYIGRALSRPVSEVVALAAGALALAALVAAWLWALGLGLGGAL